MDKALLEERKQILIDVIESKEYRPMKVKELAIVLNVPKSDREDLQKVLDELVADGKIYLSKKGKYDKYRKSNEETIIGKFIGNKRGFGFVESDEIEEDIFIPESMVHGAFHNDTVEVKLMPYRKRGSDRRREGEVIRIISHEITRVVGTYRKSKSFGFVICDNQKLYKDIYVDSKYAMGAQTGHKVVVKLTKYGDKAHKPEGKIVEILGHINDPGTDILSIVKAYDIPMEFPYEVMKQVEGIPEEISKSDINGRLDIRNWTTFTIDGEDAKDLDDAITLEKNGDIYHLGVHIADVSQYVTEDSPLDREALKRGTSVYLADRVIPMLPHKLSNGICSLNQGEDRLALSCIMEIDPSGKVIGHRIAETILNVDRRMSYTNVQKILDGSDEAVLSEYRDYIDNFKLMKELADILKEKRFKRGSIDFDFPESKLVLDEKGVPIEIKAYERTAATKIIEDFMLLANETVAEDYFWQEMPFVYRSHEKPEPEKMMKLSLFINNFGYGIKTSTGADGIHPKEIQKLLKRIEGSDEEALISRLTLRSMKQARYTTEANGHFGLSTQYYCHFTSPIRRYPDLQIHRIIKENLHGGMNKHRITHYNNILPDVADTASKTERRAEEAERETIKLKKVQYMSKRIGMTYEGVISGITAYGMYVELPNTVEGMIRVTSMKDDYYYYDEERYEMVGKDSGREYKLGQKINIVVTKTDIPSRTIDFEEDYIDA